MDRFDRIFELNKILSSRRTPISRENLQEKLGCSRATVARTIQEAKNILGAPIRYNRQLNGYQYEINNKSTFELPGLWFNASEVFALLTTSQLLSKVQPGLLEPHIEPFRKRLEELLEDKRLGSQEISKRIKILQTAPRLINTDTFQVIANALVSRNKIKMLYHGRARDKNTERWVSPQRLIYYRDNWYLDAWCHLRNGLRSFSLDRIHVVYVGEQADTVPETKLDTHFTDAYGIFSGKAKYKAVIKFSGEASKWIADEQWHPKQKSRLLKSGGIELTIPYSDPRELIMDIMKYGAEAEVLKPVSLKNQVRKRLEAALEKYQK
tara:strand:- start:1616 stop:2584 length:969 start_codon:yes stop_codon:yes gene_type:complete